MADVPAKLRHRIDPAAFWAGANPVLLRGEPGYEEDTTGFKIGDGVTAWNDLFYRVQPAAVGATAPTIITQPSAASVTAGATAIFTVAASGTAPLAYQWQRNAVNIVGATAATYTTAATTVSGGTANNGDAYRCVVTNAAGSATSNAASLTVAASGGATAPTITVQPSAQSVTAGGTATFSVSASGTAPLTYQWQRNSTDIGGATSASYTTPATTVSGGSANNGDAYRCVVTNSAGSATSNAAALTVAASGSAPANTVLPAITGTAQDGQTLTCSTGTWSNSPVSYAYQWKRAGANIGGATGSTYACVTADVGSTLTCTVTATNATGSASATSAATAAVSAAPVAPSAVTGVTAGVATDVTQPLTWTAPVTGTAPITYTVGYRLGSSTGAYTTAASGISGTAYTVTGLSASTAYDYSVTPTNAVGSGPAGLLNDASTAAPALDTRPGWFAAPTNANTVGTAAFVTGRNIVPGSANGGKAGTAVVTTTGSDYAWFAIANAASVNFLDVASGFSGGFTLIGGPFVDGNSTSWYLWKSDFPASYTTSSITIS